MNRGIPYGALSIKYEEKIGSVPLAGRGWQPLYWLRFTSCRSLLLCEVPTQDWRRTALPAISKQEHSASE